MCTTVPPAKSRAPLLNSQPVPPQTARATGRYEKVNQITAKISTALNLVRSAKPPTARAVVMAAKVAWNTMNTYSGITTPSVNVAAVESALTPASMNLLKSPMYVASPLKARL
jgi:hypothetical protein